MKRTLVLLAIAALVLPATALGKGPASAEIQGPGAGGINLSGGGENFGTPLGDLVQYAGFFPAMFRQTPDPMSDQRPQGDLGPKYTVTYSLPGPDGEADTVTQELYPYANPPVSYTKPGQEFFEAEKSRGGWYVSTAALRERLIDAGLPRTPPATPTADDAGVVSTGTPLLAAVAIALLLLGTALLVWRRTRPAATA